MHLFSNGLISSTEQELLWALAVLRSGLEDVAGLGYAESRRLVDLVFVVVGFGWCISCCVCVVFFLGLVWFCFAGWVFSFFLESVFFYACFLIMKGVTKLQVLGFEALLFALKLSIEDGAPIPHTKRYLHHVLY